MDHLADSTGMLAGRAFQWIKVLGKNVNLK